MTKITLLSALTALLILPSFASAAMTADFAPGPNENWPRVLTVTTDAAGNAESKGEQTVEINVTSGAFSGGSYRTVKMNKNQTSYTYSGATALGFGPNTITVGAVTNAGFLADSNLGRSVKIQFNIETIGFNSLTVNGVNANPDEVDGSPFLGRSLSASEHFDADPDVNWQAVLPLTTIADGAPSQGVQTAVINVTYIPQGGANYQVHQTTANGGDEYDALTTLVLGENTITVSTASPPPGTATSDRAVDVQFSNDAVEFDALTVNGEDMLAGPISPAEGTQGQVDSQTISESTGIFDTTSNAIWVRNATLVLNSQGQAVSGLEQTLVMDVTYIPAGGANYRVYKTLEPTESGTLGDFSAAQALVLGENTITVSAVSYNRSVKIQFDNVDVEFNALSINGDDRLTITPAEGTQGTGNPISQYEVFGTTTSTDYPAVATMTDPADGAASQSEQTAVINVTYIPAGGASWRTNSTNAAGNYITSDAQDLIIGGNTITVSAVDFDRTIKVQFSSDAIEIDALTFNSVDQLVSTPGTGTQGIGQSISESTDIFVATGTSAQADGWSSVTTMTTTGNGAPGQGAQTLEINVTYLPGGGAQMRGWSQGESGGGTFYDGQTLNLGPNTIIVPATVGWADPSQGRATKVQVSSDAIEFDALTFNGVNQVAPAIGTPDVGDPISDFSDIIIDNYNATWFVATMAAEADGAASQGEQTAVINVTYIPAGGAYWRSNITDDLGDYIASPKQNLVIGENTFTVPAVGFDRTVKIQFSSNAIEFTTLTFNGVNPLAVDDIGDTVTIANSNLFNAGPDGTWVAVLTTAVSQDGASSQSQQTVVLNVTSPPSGANYRVVKTVADGTWDTGDSQLLGLGANTITVNSVGFDRSVKIEFDSDAVEYDALSVNGVARTIGADAVSVPSVNINGSTLTWTEADGTTLQFSDDLESWTSLPSATSPYSPSTTPDRFYRTISEEEE